MRALSGLERVGVGVCYQDGLRPFYASNRDVIDYIEVPAIPGRLGLVQVDGFRVIVHSIHLSPMSASPIDPEVLEEVRGYVARFPTPWWSEHLSFYKVPGHDTQFVLPPIRTEESLDVVCRNVRALMAQVPLPFILENIPDHFQVPGPLATIDDGLFIGEVCRRTGAGLLLDLNHAHITAHNAGLDAADYLLRLPLEQTVEIHVAGSRLQDGILWDAHEEPLKEEMYGLLDLVLQRQDVKAVTLECLPGLPGDVLRGELERLRAAFARAAAARDAVGAGG
ncbi:MAG: DUF692 family multinuclear iron-containing protein [Vicinamibacteria bacterium]